MNKRYLMIAAGGAALGLALALTAARPAADAADSATVATTPIPATIGGTLAYRERIALPPGSEAVVQLLGSSRAGKPASVIAEQRIVIAGQVPVPFQLAYDAASIDPRRSYTVAARIESGGKLLFVTDTATPVITQGGPGHVDLVLKKLAAP